jgi:hypothetical protein
MRRALLTAVALLHVTQGVRVGAQGSRAGQSADSAAPYLRRGDEVERRYNAYRVELERFFETLSARVEHEAPDLRAKLVPPAAVLYGYQILPNLLVETPWTPKPARIVLSPFSWSRTESLIDRDTPKLHALRARLSDSTRVSATDRRTDVEFAVGEYLTLVQGQKLMTAQIQYNRLWQAEVARNPAFYQKARTLQDAALERQALTDSLSVVDERSRFRRLRVDTLTRLIDDAVRKLPTPDFVRIVHLDPHRWVFRVPVYTDIEDSAFVERFRVGIESAWHVRVGEDDYSVALEIHRMTAGRLYVGTNAPAKSEHINIADHLARFPLDGAVLTTGANTIYSIGRSILVSPHAVGPSALVHEFGHVLGFRDGYFRSYQDRGSDGYEIVEVILDPESVVAAPERGRVRREHFDQMLGERRR